MVGGANYGRGEAYPRQTGTRRHALGCLVGASGRRAPYRSSVLDLDASSATVWRFAPGRDGDGAAGGGDVDARYPLRTNCLCDARRV
jgi:hypothetical protein